MDIIAHRGASGLAPENTLEAFELAVGLGADGIELDVRRAADGALVVHHDAALDGLGPLCRLSRAEIPDRIPSLEAALEACDGVWVNIEIKNSADDPDFDPDRSLAADVLATGHPAGQRWLISSFDLEMIDRVRALDPTVPTAWLVVDLTDEVIGRCVDGGHVAVHPWVERLTRSSVEAAHAAGLVVNTWTCNDADRLAELDGWGVDGVCTDLPDLGRRVVRRSTPDRA